MDCYIENRRKLQLADINVVVIGSRGMSPRLLWAVGAILADLILAV